MQGVRARVRDLVVHLAVIGAVGLVLAASVLQRGDGATSGGSAGAGHPGHVGKCRTCRSPFHHGGWDIVGFGVGISFGAGGGW